MRFLTGVLAAGLFVGVALAADGDFALTGENTQVKFTGSKKEGKHNGGFKKLSGTATVTGTDPTTAKIEVTIETGSLYTDEPSGKLTGHLKSPDFFDVKTNPTAKFISTKVEKLPDVKDVYKVTGDFTLNGKKREISFPAKITVGNGKLKLHSEFKINRMDFGLGSKFPASKLDEAVSIRVNVDAGK